MKVLLAILSHNRPGMLRNLIGSLAQCLSPSAASVSIVVIDDSREDIASEIAGIVGERVGPYPANYVYERRSGIAAGRNRAIDEALTVGADALIFVDDDQIIPKNWLADIIRIQQETKVDVVKTKVVFKLEPPGNYSRYFAPDESESHTELRKFGDGFFSTNGILITNKLYRDFGIRFDEKFPRSGGEDLKFFAEAMAKGANTLQTRETYLYEIVEARKQTFSWIVARSYGHGNNIICRGINKRSRKSIFFRSIVRIGYFGVRTILTAWSLDRCLPSANRTAYEIGMLAGILGFGNEEYATPTGR